MRLAFVFFLIPRHGIVACLWGMLASELLVAGLHLLTLHRLVPFSFSAFYRILRPMAAITLAVLISRCMLPLAGIAGLLAGCAAIAGFYLLFLAVTRKR